MERSYHLIIFILLIIASGSCSKDFLDVKDNSNLNRQSYVKDLNSMGEFLNGVYFMMSTENSEPTAYPELVADNLMANGSSLKAHYNWSMQAQSSTPPPPSNLSMYKTWQTTYLIIRACNFVIEDVDKYRNENAQKADNFKGQAYVLRALLHFKLVNIFAQPYKFSPNATHPGIPYITTSDITAPYSRQTVEEVYSTMIADITTAIGLLPSNITDIRYMNTVAARALLARVYLYKEDFSNARTLSTQLANQQPLMSIQDGYPTDLFKNKPPTETEVLFQFTPINDATVEGGISIFLGRQLESFSYSATNDIAIILKENPNDIRSAWVQDTLGNKWKVKKFPQGVADRGYTPSTDYYPPIIRSSEMFLTAAESLAKTGDETSARNFLNAIRKRADPSNTDVTETGQALLDLIYKERRKELCFEGLRMYDLQRWKAGVQRLDALPGSPTILPYPNDKAIAPIPVEDVKLAGLVQNSGY